MKTRKGYLIQRNGIYYVCWSLNGKKFMRTTGTRDRRQAEKKRAEIMEPFIMGDEVTTLRNIAATIEGRNAEIGAIEDASNPPLPLSQVWQTYCRAANRPDSGPATIQTYGYYWHQFESWLKEKHPKIVALRDVSEDMAEEYAEHLTDREITANTFNKHIRLLELVCRVLKSKARLSANVWHEIQRKRHVAQGRRELTPAELRLVCGNAEGELKPLLAIGLYLGARLGDAVTMEWANVNLKGGCVRFMPRKTARRSGKTLTIPIHPVLHDILNETSPSERNGYVTPGLAKLYLEKGPYAVSAIIQRHFHHCGLTTVREGTGKGTGRRASVDLGFHSFRHSAVSLLREAGAPLSVTQELIGHDSPAIHRLYTHTGDDALRKAVAALPAVIGENSAPALPLAKMIDVAPVRTLAESMTARNWKSKRDEILAKLNTKED